MLKRQYVKKPKVVDVTPINKTIFDTLLKAATKIKPPK